MLSSTNKRPYHRILCVVFLCSLLLVFVDNAQASSLPSDDHESSITPLPANPTKSFVAFGDSNTIPYLPGTTSWFTFLERRLRGHYSGLRNSTSYSRRSYSFTFTNLSYGAKTIAVGNPNQQYDIQAALNLISYTDYGIVLLGTNDAWQGIPIADFQYYYRQFIMTVKTSGKIGKLFVLAVPPMMFPYNCIGPTCWNNTHNPQTERVAPFNTFLSGIKTYCTSIGFNCAYINASSGMQLNAAYLNAGDGIHFTNTSQNIISNNIFNVLIQQIPVLR